MRLFSISVACLCFANKPICIVFLKLDATYDWYPMIFFFAWFTSLSMISRFTHVTVQFSSVAQSCPTLCDPMDCSMAGLPVHHQLPELTQTHVHQVRDAIQPSHPLLSPCPRAFNLSQHQSLLKWVSSSHQVAKLLEFQLQHQSFQWIFSTDFFRMDRWDLLAVQGTLKSLLQHHNSKA